MGTWENLVDATLGLKLNPHYLNVAFSDKINLLSLGNYNSAQSTQNQAGSLIKWALVQSTSNKEIGIAAVCTDAAVGDYVFASKRGDGFVVRSGNSHDNLIGGATRVLVDRETRLERGSVDDPDRPSFEINIELQELLNSGLISRFRDDW